MDTNRKRYTKFDINLGGVTKASANAAPTDTDRKRYTKFDINLSNRTKASTCAAAANSHPQTGLPAKKIRKIQQDEHVASTVRSVQQDEPFTLADKPVRSESPWSSFQRSPVDILDLGGKITVARSKAQPATIVGIRKYPTGKAKDLLPVFRRLQHENIVRVLDAFITKESLYLVFEDMRLSLEHFVVSPAYPTSLQLGTILGQVLDGLKSIQEIGYGHGSLSCENILVSHEGRVKVGGQELFQVISPKIKARDILCFGKVTMKLMQKLDRDDGVVGIDDPGRWQDNPDTIQFASSITSSKSLGELRKNSFIESIWERHRRWEHEILWDLVVAAQFTVRRYYCYKEAE
ncbi:hypothetical protein B0T10DRAFT_567956 [Thelonectria olida]|uniref:Protein kinase domain-containing protein n=1 Tax=Thelonectria olida TaxID=1576542 RepID=A0A9P8VTX8_9HYPO|nr:hypothetical protein B0T10DRAFT_567956 [Thelonectria olida]